MSDLGRFDVELRRVVNKIAPKIILLLIRRFGAERSVAEDMFQTVILKLLETGRMINLIKKDELEVSRYLATATVRQYYNLLRGQTRAERNIDKLAALVIQSSEPDVDKEEMEIRADLLDEAIGQLKEPYRAIISTLIVDEVPLSEISKRFGIKRGSIYTQFSRALEQLKYHIEKRQKERLKMAREKRTGAIIEDGA